MKLYERPIILILLLGSLGLCGRILAQCPNVSSAQDDLVWSILNDDEEYQTWFRDEFCYTLELHEDDWKSGWGWDHLEDHTRAFAKMYTAARVLYSGLGSPSTNWLGRSISIGTGAIPQVPCKPVLSFDNNGMAHVFLRDRRGHLIHVFYNPYSVEADVGSVIEDISALTAPPTSVPTFGGDIVLVKGPTSGRMRVLGLPGDAIGNVILYEQVAEGSTGAWTVSVLSPTEIVPPYSNAPMMMGNPIVLQESGDRLHLFGASGIQCLLEYDWSPENGVYARVHLDTAPPKWKISNRKSAVAGIYFEDTGCHIFCINRPTGELLHFIVNRGQWKTENLTATLGADFRVDSNSTLSVQTPSPEEISVFCRNDFGDLLRYRFSKTVFANGNEFWAWRAENITRTGENLVEPEGYQVSPVKIEPGFAVLDYNRIFGFDWQNNFVCFKYTNGRWRQIRHLLFDVSTYLPDWHKSDRLVAWPVAVKEGSALKVYGVNTKRLLVEYRNVPPSMSWSIDRVPIPTSEYASKFWMEGFMVDAQRHPNGELHVVGIRQSSFGLVHFMNIRSHSWHSTADYINWASGSTQDADFHYEPYNTDGHDAYSYCGYFREDRVEMWCPSFAENYSPASRAAIMLHEATHIKYGDWLDVWNGDHDPKDEWYHHGLDAIPWGTLDPRTEGHRHSMYQIQAEFLSDIAEFPAGWVPMEIIQSAKNAANGIIDDRFSNTPGWKVGEPRPF
jgi:hypothetical protein